MTERTLGPSGLTTPPLILGGNVFGWTADRPTSHKVLDAFVHGGGRMIDTADAYSTWVPGHQGGESESIIGEWLHARGRRDDVVIATKVGADMYGSRGLAPQRIAKAVDASLTRLRTDYIDLYFAHFDDEKTPLADTLGAFDALVTSGKVRAIGASNYTATRLREALDASAARSFASYSVLQPHYNLVERAKFEGPLQTLCIERDVAAVPYSALAAGFLTGKYRGMANPEEGARGGAVKGYLNDFGYNVLATLDSVAKESDATPAQVALAWLASQPAVAAPIASATRVAQVEELLGGMRLVLTPEQLTTLEAASRQQTAH
jgi:aryl-alcohol dehydrogenase-like predicted oxidoreductase